MARVTRSRKIDIAEDHTALASQIPLPETPAKQPTVLVEKSIPIGANTMPSMEDSAVATELDHLKAAYRNAIGTGKKGRKGKNRKRGKQESVAESEDNVGEGQIIEEVENANPSPVIEAPGQTPRSHEGSLFSLFYKLNARDLI